MWPSRCLQVSNVDSRVAMDAQISMRITAREGTGRSDSLEASTDLGGAPVSSRRVRAVPAGRSAGQLSGPLRHRELERLTDEPVGVLPCERIGDEVLQHELVGAHLDRHRLEQLTQPYRGRGDD